MGIFECKDSDYFNTSKEITEKNAGKVEKLSGSAFLVRYDEIPPEKTHRAAMTIAARCVGYRGTVCLASRRGAFENAVRGNQ